ncbi:MAG TPA: ribonuclease HI [Anaerolineae bacterium]|nr:ribonuclease HI [Anaerolineae bacterium]
MELSKDAIKLYLRSSCRGNPGPGGWGIVVEVDDELQQYSGNIANTTNNRMEVTAAIEALALLPPKTSAHLFTTSDYLFQGATKWIHGWRKRNWTKRNGQPVANSDLWQLLDQRMPNYAIQWVNAKGQALEGLEIAGKLAAAAAKDFA